MPYAVKDPHAGARASDVAVRAAHSPTLAEHVLALQRSHGNAAVASAVQTRRRRSRPRARIALSVRKGDLGPSIPRTPTRLLKEDVLVVRARVDGVRDPKHSVSVRIDHDDTGLRVGEGHWRGDTYLVEIRGTELGSFPLEISLSGGGVHGQLKRTVKVQGDAADQQAAIAVAIIRLERRFRRAEEKLAVAGDAFNAAYRRHVDQLTSAWNAQRLDDDIKLGLLLAGLGGFAGGAVGGILKPRVEAWLTSSSRHPELREGITDLGKDIVKFSVRTLGKPSAAGLGDSTAPPGRPGSHLRAGGRNPNVSDPLGDKGTASPEKPVAADPLKFHYQLKAALEAEADVLLGELEAVAERHRTEIGRSRRVLFDEDPVALVSRPDRVLDAIIGQLETDEDAYFERFWGEWVKAYYYRVERRVLTLPQDGDLGPYAVYGPGWRIGSTLRNVARSCGYPSLDAFLKKYPPDLQRKVKEAERKNACYWQKC